MIKKFTVYSLQFTVLALLLLYPITYALFPTYAQQATLTLTPSTGTLNKNCNFSLDVMLNTGGAPTDGTDAIIIYDNSKLSALTIDKGTIYNEYPGNNVDGVAGRVTISGLASVDKPFNGTGKLATVNFSVKDSAQVGATLVRFDFNANDKSLTTDSNVVERGSVSDILSSVVNGNFTVGTGTCAAGIGTGTGSGVGSGTGTGTGGVDASGSGQTKVPYKELPQGGTKEFTFMLGIVGATLTVLGIIGLSLL